MTRKINVVRDNLTQENSTKDTDDKDIGHESLSSGLSKKRKSIDTSNRKSKKARNMETVAIAIENSNDVLFENRITF